MGRGTLAYTAPFATFLALMAVSGAAGLGAGIAYPLRTAGALLVWLAISRGVFAFRPARAAASAAVGAAVFLIWIGPELLWPGYRSHWVFANPLTSPASGDLPAPLREDFGFIVIRVLGSSLVVPVIEELFWRGWLMRWLVHTDINQVPLGTFRPFAFWATALLFGAEHGPYWDVGVVAGAIYNWWMVRTRNLADCVLAHGISNFCLAVYVLGARAWAYWV